MKKYKTWIVLGLVILVAFFVRVWRFDDLLTFKMDQVRDVKLVEEAYLAGEGGLNLEGVGMLPLLGPRAAKTYLRLGPAVYYFDYLSLLIFGDHPWAMAVPDFIFSILTIPLFYYFLRQAFNQRISLMTTIVFASSFFLVQYSRFAWNPNSIPFWSLLYFLGLYKIIRNFWLGIAGSGKWLLVAVVGYGVVSQLHFIALLAYPLIGLFFLVISLLVFWYNSKNKSVAEAFDNNQFVNFKCRFSENFHLRDLMLGISWRYWFGALVILGTMYLPVILSEVCTHGDNWMQFKYALSGRGGEEFSWKLKLIQSLKLHSEYFWFSLTSFAGGDGVWGVVGFLGVLFLLGMAFLRKVVVNFKFNSLVGLKNFKETVLGKLVLRVIAFCHFLLKMLFKKLSFLDNFLDDDEKKSISRKLFFLLILLWFGVMFLLYTKLAFDVLKPRYWLLEVPIFFVFLAVFFQILTRFKKMFQLVWVLVFLLSVLNYLAVGNWYWVLLNQKDSKFLVWDLKLKDANKIPWKQLGETADYIESLAEKTEKEICFYTTGEYRPVYDYIFSKRGLSEKIRRISFKNDTDDNCLFVTIDHHRRRDLPRIPKDHKEEFEKVEGGKKEIGFVTVWRVHRNAQRAVGVSREFVDKTFKKKVSEEEMEKKEFLKEKKKPKKPRRKERVRWKDLGCLF